MSIENPAAGDLPVGYHLEERCLSVLQSGLWVDCTFIVGQDGNKEEISAIKSVLGMASPVFAAMLFGRLAETKPIEIPDVDSATFKRLLQFIYVHKLELRNVEEAFKVITVAHKYMIPDLVQNCVSYLDRSNITQITQVIEMLNIGLYCNIEELKLKALEVFCYNAGTFLKESEILDVSAEFLVYLFNQNGLNISGDEMKVIDAAVRWAAVRCEEQKRPVGGAMLRAILEEARIFSQLRFLTLTEKEIADGPVKIGILTPDEVKSISLYIRSAGVTPLPVLICTNREPRNKPQQHIIYLHKEVGLVRYIESNTYNFDWITMHTGCDPFILQGIVLPTQNRISKPTDTELYTYEEHFQVGVKMNGSQYAAGFYKGRVPCNSEVTVWLNHGLHSGVDKHIIKQRSEVCMKILFLKSGEYLFYNDASLNPKKSSTFVRSLNCRYIK